MSDKSYGPIESIDPGEDVTQPAKQHEVNRYYIMGSAVTPMSDGEPCYTPLTNVRSEIHTVPLVMASDYAALQSELNEARTSIAHLLIELDAVPKIPCVSAMAKALSDKHADEAGVNRADTWKQYSHEYIEDVEYMLADAPHVSFTDEGNPDDDMRISLISDEKIGEVPCSEHPDAPHGFNRNASHCADRYVCDCEGWVPTDEGEA